MACGEYISVASQRDAECADIAKEVQEQRKGPTAQVLGLAVEAGGAIGAATPRAVDTVSRLLLCVFESTCWHGVANLQPCLQLRLARLVFTPAAAGRLCWRFVVDSTCCACRHLSWGS